MSFEPQVLYDRAPGDHRRRQPAALKRHALYGLAGGQVAEDFRVCSHASPHFRESASTCCISAEAATGKSYFFASTLSGSDLRQLVGRRLVDLVDPVAEEEVCMAAPAVLRRKCGVIVREIVVRQLDRHAGIDVAEIFLRQDVESYST